MACTVRSSRSALVHSPPRCRSRALITPLSPPTSRQQHPSVGPSSAVISRSLRCFSTERLYSAIGQFCAINHLSPHRPRRVGCVHVLDLLPDARLAPSQLSRH